MFFEHMAKLKSCGMTLTNVIDRPCMHNVTQMCVCVIIDAWNSNEHYTFCVCVCVCVCNVSYPACEAHVLLYCHLWPV